MKTPADKTLWFTFKSHPAKDPKVRWTAKVSFPPGSTAETVLPVEIVDGEETPVAKGLFEFAGLKLKVVDGRTSLTFGQFVAGKHETALWLRRPGMSPIPGGLTFA